MRRAGARRYHGLTMSLERRSLEELHTAAGSSLEEEASRLRDLLGELAASLRPFPSFLNMASIQAVELLLPLPLRPTVDRGCVVVSPHGEICELNLYATPGIAGVSEMDHVEEFRELELPAEEYIVYAATAIRLLNEELRRRG